MLSVVKFWILLSTLLVVSGWVLSALHELNAAGYGVMFALGAGALIFWRQKTQWRPRKTPVQLFQKFKRRFKRPAPLIFFLLGVMSFVSGCLYPPFNSDTLSYRIPRVLHWLGQGQWHWIHTMDMRMNVAACDYEWMMAPLILFTHSDRLLFLINWIPYLMLPGLIFSVLRLSGVYRRVAWWWSWLLASGWCYVMQSASVTNDSFAVVYAMAAVVLALRAGETKAPADIWLSLLAGALVTGVKQTGMLLVVLWAAVVWPQWRTALARPVVALLVTACGLLISGLPIAIMNSLHTGDWTGLSALTAWYPQWRIKLDSPFWGFIGNLFFIPLQNLVPPFFPWSGAWNRLMDQFLETPFGAHFGSFEGFGKLSPGISESSAGIGLAIVLMAIISILGAMKLRREAHPMRDGWVERVMRLVPWLLLIVFMAKCGEAQNVRHLSPYYVFLFPLLIAGASQELLVRKSWWQRAALACMATSIGLLVFNINRPLFPAETIMTRLAASHPQSKSIGLLESVYDTPAMFQNLKHNLRRQLPAGERLIGFAGQGNLESEPIVWQPWGSTRVEWVLPQDAPEQLSRLGIHYVVIENYASSEYLDIHAWMTRYHAYLMADIPFHTGGHNDLPSHVYITRLESQ
jgi:hypothetical protein